MVQLQPLMSPKEPLELQELYRKRREVARFQMLEREISFLQEELKSSEGLQKASICCQEITNFVMTNSDPLLPMNNKTNMSNSLWKWLCWIPCFNMSCICCCYYDGCFPSCNCDFLSMKCSSSKWSCCNFWCPFIHKCSCFCLSCQKICPNSCCSKCCRSF
ncbi:PREDICTED: guanine nucleotide-binding protein subunit gamma 3-like [Lupinus angustifolius]|uniref:guanine nucleotide-binding protein subunit gamma 3-like n=1 Tax=Lupinus angustifolius TaxID=3871 RepID=UPI00092F5034|nr:PREDICTED: guanine nucleotide-binding protein subunit gamma 3-like [Lupinus angustifolius]